MHDAAIPVHDQVRQVWPGMSLLFLEAFHTAVPCLRHVVPLPLSGADCHA